MAHRPQKKPLDFGGNPVPHYVRVKVRVGLQLPLGEVKVAHLKLLLRCRLLGGTRRFGALAHLI